MTVGEVFCHGAWGYDDDLRLAESLAAQLGDGYDVRFPRLPDDDDAAEERGMRVIGDEIARAPEPVVLVGHSAGGYLLLKHQLNDDLRVVADDIRRIVDSPKHAG